MDTVRLAFEQDLTRFVKFVKAKNKNGGDSEVSVGKANGKQGKCHNTLFNLWSTYEQKLGTAFLGDKLLLMGDLLYSLKEYNLSVNQCYMRYFMKFGSMDAPYDLVMNGLPYEKFKQFYFSDDINRADSVSTIRALLGITINHSCELLLEDPKIKMIDTPSQLVASLKVMQFTMQIALEKEEYCWLVYNGTIHIYTICRQMLSNTQSKKALEYLIWACVCMESSVPLMTTRYLTWRCQLYTAVCQCYYDINAGAEAEAFAKRGINMVQELQEIDEMSVSKSGEGAKMAFKEAKLRLQVMAFKRNVYESRRRPKGILRPKNKPPLKDIAHNPWPRTATEKMLSDTFTGRSAQFLAVVEALSDSKRRIAQTSLGAPESDDSILDVFAELFFAGLELISGGGGNRPPSPGRHDSLIGGELKEKTLIEMAANGENGINISSIVRFVQYAFNYESWDTFESLVQPTIDFLTTKDNIDQHLIERKSLELLDALLPLNMSKLKKKVTLGMEDRDNSEVTSIKQSAARVLSFVDDILNLVEVIESCLDHKKSASGKLIIGGMTDIFVDACLFVWTKCKNHYNRVTSSSVEVYKHVLQDAHLEKWMKALSVVQRAMTEVRVADFDQCVCAEASLKLALLIGFVCSEDFLVKDTKKDVGDKSATQQRNKSALRKERLEKLDAIAMYLGCAASPWSLLSFARRMLQDAIKTLNDSPSSVLNMETCVADCSLMKDVEGRSTTAGPVALDASALHVELLYLTQRIDCKLALFKQGDVKSQKKGETASGALGITASAGKNSLAKAIYFICKAEANQSNAEQRNQLLKDSYDLLQKTGQSEAKLLKANNVNNNERDVKPRYGAPVPRLVFRSPTVMVFKPREFVAENGEEVNWYKLFVRSAAGNNVKVRPSDMLFPGTGKEVPNGANCVLKVSGLIPNERYCVAVAAYNSKGQCIGENVGETSRPILASSPLPVAIAYGYLIRAAYNSGLWQLAKTSFNILWQHFVLDPETDENESKILSARENTDVKPFRLNMETISQTSAVLLRYFIQSIFISVDISIKEGALFCDSLCDFKPLYDGQNARLDECRKLLVAINVAGLVNDSSTSLQAVVQCYGLLAPLLQMQIHTKPVLQVLCHCFAVLQELQSLIKNRKHSSVAENLQHMVSCISFYVAKVLEEHHRKFGAIRILESGSRIIMGDSAPSIPDSAATTNTAFGYMPGPRKMPKKGGALKKMKIGAVKPGYKGIAELTGSENIATELKILETYVLKLKKYGDPGKDEEQFELNGTEESPFVHAYLSCLSPTAAYKEVSKFKRRAHFLEHFVVVLERALKEGLHHSMIEWTKDAVTWLTRRNEILVNKQTGDQRAGTVVVAVDDDKNKQFSSSVVEYGKKPANNRDLFAIEELQRQNTRKDEQIEEKGGLKNAAKHSDKKSRAKRPIPLTDVEKKIKDGTQKLQDLLPEYYKIASRRRRLRAVTLEEIPWRAQMNLLMAQCYFDLSNDKLKAVIKFYGLNEHEENVNLMEQDWFTLSNCGALIVSWAGCPMQSESEIEPTVDIGGRSIANEERDGRTTNLRIDRISGKGKVVMKGRTSQTDKQSQRNLQDDTLAQLTDDPFKIYLNHISNTFLYLTRCMVLACRGKNWVLLQNAARELYNVSNILHKKVMSLAQRTLYGNQKDMPMDVKKLRKMLCAPFFVAADSLLDMMNYIYWDCKEKAAKQNNGQSDVAAESRQQLPFGGSIKDHAGGLSLNFDKILDDTSQTHFMWLKKIIWYAVEIMYFEEKWEKLVEIINRFNALTRDRFAESLLPIAIFAQRQLRNRMNSIPGPERAHPRVAFDRETGIPLQAFLDLTDVVSIEPGAHIDPEGHNLYDPGTEGLALVSVPLNIEDNLDRLHQLLDTKYYSARALEHSRRLLVLYLAGKQNGSTVNPRMRQRSRVSFIANQIKPQSTTPADLSQLTFDDNEDIECYPLPDTHCAVVISSYDKTIGVGGSRTVGKGDGKEKERVVEEGMERRKTKKKEEWKVGKVEDDNKRRRDALKSWRELLLPAKNSIHSSKLLLKTCGIWGCILGGVLATKIARYIHTTNLGMRTEFCCLAAALFQGLLCSSLPHPSAYIDYCGYEIGLQHNVKELLPGIDLFSDIFRADCATVLGALLWTTNELLRCGFYLEVLPLLLICQYLATDVCESIQTCVRVMLMKLLTKANLDFLYSSP
eukprot:gene6315-7038_t